MKILVLSDLWPPFPGGFERMMFNLARDLMERGEDVSVLTGYENSQVFDGPPVIKAPIGIGVDHAEGWWWIESMLLGKPDVIVTGHLYAREFAAELAACGIPVVQVVCNGPRLECASLAVFISEWVRHEAGNARPSDLTILPPVFVDVRAYDHGEAIGFVKPIPHKGVDLFWQFAESMPERQFVVLRGEWQTLEVIRDLPNVKLLEPVLDLRDFYRECRLVLMPSLSEDAGTIPQDCTVNRIPCVSSDVGGLRETNAGGYRVPTHDVVDWTVAVRRLDDPGFYDQVVQQQLQALANRRQPERLAELHQRIRELA